jgi:hypothetical protein
MKKVLAFAMLFVIMAVSALAQLSVSDVKIGSTSQTRGENATSSITITNIGTQTIQNMVVSFPGIDSKYKIWSQLSATSVAPSSSVTLTVKGYVPMDFDAVDEDGKKVSFDIGDVSIAAKYANNTDASKTVNLFMEAENKLSFGTKSEVKIGTSTKSLRDDKKFSDVKRGENIEVTIEAKNKFSNSGDCQDESKDCNIDGIDAKIESRDSDLDVEEDLGFGDINSDDTDSDTVSFSIADDIDESDYKIDVWMTGEDENGALHGDFWTFTLEVNVPNDQIDITDFELSPSKLSCTDKKATLYVTLKNTGSSDQNDVSIFIDSSKLDIKDSIYNIEIDEGDTASKTFDLDLPSKLSPGNYYVQIIANVDSDEETDRQSATLVVAPCDTTKPTTNTTTTPTTPTTPSNTEVKVVEVPPTSGVIYGKPKTGTDSSVWLIAALFAIALMLLLILVVVLLRK